MPWFILSWLNLRLNGFGAGSVFSDLLSSSVEQKTKLVLFSLAFPDSKLVFCEGFNAKQKPLQQKEGTQTFHLVGAPMAAVVIWPDINNYSLGTILTKE